MSKAHKTALIMAGGTGGHIFPGLAVARALHQQGWQVHWLGASESMESRLVPEQGFNFKEIAFGGVRGKGLRTKLAAPIKLAKAVSQARAIVAQVQPDVVLGFGGYISMPGGIAARLAKVPLFLHEQNSIAGMSNRLLARIAQQSFSAFPNALPHAQVVGNPLRAAFMQQGSPSQRFAERCGPLRLLVVGGSLGAKALNSVVPQALALIAAQHRPHVLHQSGKTQLQELQANYAAAQVDGELVAFIDDTASAFAQADIVLCRAGASTVTELSAVGAAACFVPYPHAVDDHQTSNARYLVDAESAWLIPQAELSATKLAAFLGDLTRANLLERAIKAHALAQTQATLSIVDACEKIL